MADQHNSNIPAVGNQISSDIPDIKENLEWHKDLLQMLCGWKTTAIASVGPPNHRAQFTHGDDDTLTIGAGSYFHDGTTRQTVFWDAAITFDLGSGGSNALSDDLGASEWHYIYIDDSAVVTQGDSELDADCFLNDTTAPTWSAAKHGWYNGNDRCIFAVLTDGTSDIVEFYHDGDIVLFVDEIADITLQDVDNSWVDAESAFTIPGFSTRAMISFVASFDTAAKSFYWRTKGATASAGSRIVYVDTNSYYDFNTIDVITDSNQMIQLYASANNATTISGSTNGWYLPIGM